MDKIRVAFFADMLLEKFDGYSRTIQCLLKYLPRDKFDFLFITGTTTENTTHGFKSIFIPAISIPTNKHYKMAIPYFSIAKLESTLDKFNPDVIHIANPSLLGMYASKYASRNMIPTVSIYHTHYVSYVKYYLRNVPMLIPYGEKYITNVNKEIYDQCDIVYVPVNDIITNLSKKGFRTDHFKIWARGIDVDMFNPNKRNVEFVRKLTRNNSKCNVLFASRLVWEKNLSTLIKIYHRADLNCYNFIIAGDGVASTVLKREMPEAIFVGNLDHKDLSVLYASSDIFLFPSYTESFGNVVLEAMASGTVVVSANSGGPVGIIEHGYNGYLCDAHDVSDYYYHIELLRNNIDLRCQLQANGLSHIKNFSWERLTDIYYNDLIELSNAKFVQYA